MGYFSLHHINLVVCAVWWLIFDDPMTTSNYDDTPEVEGRLHKKKRRPFNHGIPDWQAVFLNQALHVFFWWNEMKSNICVGVSPNVAATFHPWWTTRIWLRKLRKLHGILVFFVTGGTGWNSLPDGIRWLLDDKTHKGCQTWFRKKGCQFIIVLGCLIGTPLKVAGIYGMYAMFVKLHFGGRFHLRWRCDHQFSREAFGLQ